MCHARGGAPQNDRHIKMLQNGFRRDRDTRTGLRLCGRDGDSRDQAVGGTVLTQER